ncbi:MAG: protein tyrosine phosphatase [bacterium]
MRSPINVLFVCGRNNRRSPTAGRIFKRDRRMNIRAVGLGDTSPRRVKEADLRWAHLVLVVERKYAGRLRTAFPNVDPFPPIESLDISDEYTFMQPELVDLLKSSVASALETYYEDRVGDGSP